VHDSRKIRPCLLAAGRTKKPPSSGLSKTDYHRVAISPNVLRLSNRPKPASLQALLTSTPALPEPGPACYRPVASKAASGGRSRHPFCYGMSAAQRPDEPSIPRHVPSPSDGSSSGNPKLKPIGVNRAQCLERSRYLFERARAGHGLPAPSGYLQGVLRCCPQRSREENREGCLEKRGRR